MVLRTGTARPTRPSPVLTIGGPKPAHRSIERLSRRRSAGETGSCSLGGEPGPGVSKNVPSSRWRSAVTLSSSSRSIFAWRDRSGRARSRSPRGRSRPLAACSARMDGALEDLALTLGHCRDASPRVCRQPHARLSGSGSWGKPRNGLPQRGSLGPDSPTSGPVTIVWRLVSQWYQRIDRPHSM